MPGLEDHDDDDEAKFSILQSCLKAKLGDNFELFLGANAVPLHISSSTATLA